MGASHSGFSTSAAPGLGEAADVGRFEYNMLDLGERFDGLVQQDAASSASASALEATVAPTAFARELAGIAGPVALGDAALFHPSPAGAPSISGDGFLFDVGAGDAGISHGFAATNGLLHEFLDALHIAFV
jgi:hypothetical protein